MRIHRGASGSTSASADGAESGVWRGLPETIKFVILHSTFKSTTHHTIPIGTAYPIWTGIGAVGMVIVGILCFNEPATFWRLFFITTLILSVMGLKLMH